MSQDAIVAGAVSGFLFSSLYFASLYFTSLTFRLEIEPDVGHGAQPEPAMGIGGAVIAAQSLVVGAGAGEARDVLVLAGPAVEHGDAVFDADEDALARVDALDVRGDGDGHVELHRRRRRRALGEVDPVHALLLDVHESQAVGRRLVERPLAEGAVQVKIGLGDVPLLPCGFGWGRHCVCCCRCRCRCRFRYRERCVAPFSFLFLFRPFSPWFSFLVFSSLFLPRSYVSRVRRPTVDLVCVACSQQGKGREGLIDDEDNDAGGGGTPLITQMDGVRDEIPLVRITLLAVGFRSVRCLLA